MSQQLPQVGEPIKLQPSEVSTKVFFGGLTAAIACILTWAMELNGIIIPASVATSIASLLTIFVAYIVPERAYTRYVRRFVLNQSARDSGNYTD